MNLRGAAPLLAVLLSPALAFAQPLDDRRGPRVVLFEHPNFQGGAIVLHPGEAIDILEREPDDSGRRHFRSMMIDRGWREKQVRDALRASDEYRVTCMTARLNLDSAVETRKARRTPSGTWGNPDFEELTCRVKGRGAERPVFLLCALRVLRVSTASF